MTPETADFLLGVMIMAGIGIIATMTAGIIETLQARRRI